MKSGVYVIGAAALLFLLWIGPPAWSLSNHASQLKQNLTALRTHYTTIGEAHLQELAQAAEGVEPDVSAIQSLGIAFSEVSRARSVYDQWQTIQTLQKGLGAYFAPQTQHAVGLAADTHFIALRQEITGNGHASTLVLAYNQTASLVNEDMQSFPGSALGWLFVGQKPEFLFIDGKEKDLQLRM